MERHRLRLRPGAILRLQQQIELAPVLLPSRPGECGDSTHATCAQTSQVKNGLMVYGIGAEEFRKKKQSARK